MSSRGCLAAITVLLLAAFSEKAHAELPPGGIEGPHGNVPGFPPGDCTVCHDIVPGSTGRDAVKLPNETCLGCHTDGPTYGTGDPFIQDRPQATPVGSHVSLVTGSTRFTYGDFGAVWPSVENEQQIHCTSCHDPHRTFDPADPDPSTTNTKYIRDHTDDYRVDYRGNVVWFPSQDIKVIDNTGPSPVEVIKQVDQDIVFTGPGDLGDGMGMLAAESNVCEVCHTRTDYHRVDDTSPGQSHFNGEDCTSCHTHPSGFAPSGGQPLTGPHAVFGDPNCGACHDSTFFPGGVDNPTGLASVFCATCHDPATVASLHSHTVTGTTRFEYGLECTACHNQHGWAIANVDGSDNVKYVKARITEQIDVIDHTAGGALVSKSIDSDVVFTSPGDFANGDADYTKDVCVTCHTLTSHHQNDGDAPLGQSHFDGEDCTSCHTHPSGFAPSGGQPLTGPHAVFGDPNCGACHGSTFFPGGVNNPTGLASVFCATCHDPATVASLHSHTVTGTTRFEYGLECTACHDQHGWAIANVDGTDNIQYVKARITEQIDVIDHTAGGALVSKSIDSDVVFTSPGDFANGDTDYTKDVCVTCHTLTNHHQNDGSAAGGQSHYNGQDCTVCHRHPEGFRTPGGLSGPPLQGPHAAIPGQEPQDCLVCHDSTFFPGGADNLGGLASVFCATCHDPATVASLHSHTVTGTTRFEYGLECTACHDQHGWAIANVDGTDNAQYVKARITEQIDVIDHTAGGALVSKSIDHDVVFTGPGDFANGDADYTKDVCVTCHTLTNHHQNDGSAPGGQFHFDGQDCTGCHQHPSGFGGFDGPHPQANTDCSNCHLDDDGQPDLVGVHGGECSLCHGIDFSSTFLGPIGTWGQECGDCHNPSIGQTGFADTPTKGHRCVLCHSAQRGTGGIESIHYYHTDDANCVVCHGFIPDVGTQIGSGNRQICAVCHAGGRSAGIETIHDEHTGRGISCLECHGDQRPPVDVVFGPPVGGADIVCEICHDYESGSPREIHDEHTSMRLDCGSCHADANLQDDRRPMPPIDDGRRAQVDRGGWQECYLCHNRDNGGIASVHRRHVGDQWQWCYNCHPGDDDRPTGASGPVTEPTETCSLCHGGGHSYDDDEPFSVHHRHAGELKCYACHQTLPLLTDWPLAWLNGEGPVTAAEEPEVPSVTNLELRAQPNPFNPQTQLTYAVPEAGPVTLAVFDVRGRMVETLVNDEHRAAGSYHVNFRPDVASGVYYVQLASKRESVTTKIVLAK